jgi:nitroreductase
VTSRTEVKAVSWLTPAEFTTAVEAAVRAPSMHNSQPWRFRLGADHIDLLADPTRRLPIADVAGWASRIACGAALYNLRLALAVHGTPASVRVQPDPDNPELVARLAPEPHREPTPLELRLYRAIARRHSNRAPFLDEQVPVNVRAELISAARAEGGWLDLLLGPTAVELAAEMVRAADRALRRDDGYQAEVTAWSRCDPAALDGIPAQAGGPEPQPHELLARRDFGGAAPSGPREFEREPLLAVLGTAGDWPADQVHAGQVLQRVLLTATDLGLAASMFSQPIEVAGSREQLRIALGRQAPPQMMVRFGYAVSTPPSGRRPVSEVMLFEAAART